MKIDESKFRRCLAPASLSSEVAELLEGAESMEEKDFLRRLEANLAWKAPKMELIVWARVLDRCDGILAECVGDAGLWRLAVDEEGSPLRAKLRLVLAFIHELFENTTSRTCFASFERLIGLLDSAGLDVVHWVLIVIQTISRRTQLMSKLPEEQKRRLVEAVEALATPWEPSSLTIAAWAQLGPGQVPSVAKALDFLYYLPASSSAQHIRIADVGAQGKDAGQLMEVLAARLGKTPDQLPVDDSAQAIRLHAALRRAGALGVPSAIRTALIARLQALQILLYSGLVEEAKMGVLLPSGLLLQLVAVLKLSESSHRELQCETFRTLIAIIHYDRTNMLESLIAELSVGAFHGFLPSMVRDRLASMTEGGGGGGAGSGRGSEGEEALTTAMLSFVYHLSNYEAGREALVASGLLQSLVAMVRWEGASPDQMQFVTRSVRLIDIMLHSIHLPTFSTLRGLPAILGRLECEVERCRAEEPFVLGVVRGLAAKEAGEEGEGGEPGSAEAPLTTAQPNSSSHVLPKRAALIKSLQNFLKRVIATPTMGALTAQMMQSSLPRSLGHIISNQAYYGPALFLQSMELVTLFIQAQPSELTSLQERGLIAIVQTAILEKELPPNREFLCKLFPVLSALCTNARGLAAIQEAGVFDKLLPLLLNPAYVQALKRGRRSDSATAGAGDTASELGAAVDELVKHHASLRPLAIKALLDLYRKLNTLGTRPQYRAVLKPSPSGSSNASSASPSAFQPPSNGPSATASLQPSAENSEEDEMETEESSSTTTTEATPIPLPDYLANLAKFTDAFLGSSHHPHHPVIPNHRSTEDFLKDGGGELLVDCLSLPNLPAEMAASTSCLAPLTKLLVNLSTASPPSPELTSKLCEGAAEAVGALDSAAPQPRPLFHLSNYLACLVKILAQNGAAGNGRGGGGGGGGGEGSLKPWLKLSAALPQLSELYRKLETTTAAEEAPSLGTKVKGQLRELLVGLSRLGLGPPTDELHLPGRRVRGPRGTQPKVEAMHVIQKLWSSLLLPETGSAGELRPQLRLYNLLLFGESGAGRPPPSALEAFNDSGALASIFQALRSLSTAPASEEAAKEAQGFVEAALGLVLKLVDPGQILSPAPSSPLEAPPNLSASNLSPSELSLRFLKAAQREAVVLSEEMAGSGGVWERSGVVEALVKIWSVVVESRSGVEEAEEEAAATRNPRRAAEREAEAAAGLEELVEPEALASLVDMGFPRAAAVAALARHGSLDSAAEWLISRPNPPNPPPTNDDEELRQAIQLSMSAGIPDAPSQTSTEAGEAPSAAPSVPAPEPEPAAPAVPASAQPQVDDDLD